jgi:hypothetical protein
MTRSRTANSSGHCLMIRVGKDRKRCQRRAVRQLPLLASASAGLTITTWGKLQRPVFFHRGEPGTMKPAMQWAAAEAAREGGRQVLIAALQAARQRTLALLAAYEQALGPALQVPFSTQLNPPLWEVGHIGWFQDYWIARNPQRALGDRLPIRMRPAQPGACRKRTRSTTPASSRSRRAGSCRCPI